jgi:hypothetical protein
MKEVPYSMDIKTMSKIKFGHFTIQFPDESINRFTIFENLADFFGTEFQSEAFKQLKNELKKIELKPKPNLDYESDYTLIDSKSADTIFLVAKAIHKLSLPAKCIEIKKEELKNIYAQLKKWKRPLGQKWKIGDIFSIPLLDNTFSFGQIVGTDYMVKNPVLALFEIKLKKAEVAIERLLKARILTVWNYLDTEIANYTYKILFNADIIAKPKMVKDRKVSGGATLCDLANAYFGLIPYNVMYSEEYYDEYFQPGIKRPKNILWLNKEERNKYRRENFNIDENNNFY